MPTDDKPTPLRAEAESHRLWRDVLWALERGLGPRDLVPMLRRLARSVEVGSEAWRFAQEELAAQQLEIAPWRAALAARRANRVRESDRALALLALALTLLGHYAAATRAYRRALVLAPGHASYSHNLGHLLDRGLNRPKAALLHLAAASRALPRDPEVAASHAHALVRVGRHQEARALLTARLPGGAKQASALLERWGAE